MRKAVRTIKASAKFAGILSCVTVLITGSIIFLNSGSIDFSSFIYACQICIPAGIVAGILGHIIGKVMELSKNDKAKKKHKLKDLLIDDLLINELDIIRKNEKKASSE